MKFRSLRSLALEQCCEWPLRPTMEQLLGILQNSPLLEDLVLANCEPHISKRNEAHPDKYSSPVRTVALPYLKSFALKFSFEAVCAYVLAHLIVPAIAHLKIQIYWAFDFPYPCTLPSSTFFSLPRDRSNLPFFDKFRRCELQFYDYPVPGYHRQRRGFLFTASAACHKNTDDPAAQLTILAFDDILSCSQDRSVSESVARNSLLRMPDVIGESAMQEMHLSLRPIDLADFTSADWCDMLTSFPSLTFLKLAEYGDEDEDYAQTGIEHITQFLHALTVVDAPQSAGSRLHLVPQLETLSLSLHKSRTVSEELKADLTRCLVSRATSSDRFCLWLNHKKWEYREERGERPRQAM